MPQPVYYNPGVYDYNGNACMYKDSTYFSMNGVNVATHAPELAGFYSMTGFLDPSFGGDALLGTYKTELSVGNATMYNAGIDPTFNWTITSPSIFQ